MKLESIALTLAGLIGIAAFFMPYLTLEVPLMEDISVSGISYVQTGLHAFDLAEEPAGAELFKFIGKNWDKASDFGGLGKLLGIFFACLGPILFGMFSLVYLIKGISGKQYKSGIFFTILFVAASWAIFFFVGKDFGIDLNFFSMAGVGFWMALGSMLAAAFSLFFSKNLD